MTPILRLSARLATCLAALTAPMGAGAMTLDLPSTAARSASSAEPFGSQRLPITGYQSGDMETIWAEGAIRTDAFRLVHGGMTSLQMLAPLRAQLTDAGYDILFECADSDCGGFDFRYALEVLPAPDMHVDLGDFRYVTAQRGTGDNPDYVTLLVSRSAEHGFVQITAIGSDAVQPEKIVAATKSPDPQVALPAPVMETPVGLPEALKATGRAVLADLEFPTGSSKLAEDGPVQSLTELAAFLQMRPERSVVLVGHTDAEGALESNIDLSRQRADAVRQHLVQSLGIAPDRVQAEGVGYLAPLTTNDTPEGRSANRRVEVILK